MPIPPQIWADYEWLQSKRRLSIKHQTLISQLFVHHNNININKGADYGYDPQIKAVFTEANEQAAEEIHEAVNHELDNLEEAEDEATEWQGAPLCEPAAETGISFDREEPDSTDWIDNTDVEDIDNELAALYNISRHSR